MLCLTAMAGCGGGGHKVDPAVGALSRWRDATLTYSAMLDTCASAVDPPGGDWVGCTGASRRAYLSAAGRLRRTLNKQKASPACGRAEANSWELVVRVSSAFQREWATTAFVVRLVRSGRWDRHKSQKGGKTLPELAGDQDAARDQVIHATGRLTSALRAAC